MLRPQLRCKKGQEDCAGQVEGVSGLGRRGNKELWNEVAVAGPRPEPASELISMHNAAALSSQTPGFDLMAHTSTGTLCEEACPFNAAGRAPGGLPFRS